MLWILAAAALVAAIVLLRAGRKVAGALAALLVLALFAGFVGLALLGRPYRVPSASMEPTVEVSDRVFALRSGAPRIGDVVIFDPPAAAERGECAGPAPAGAMCERPDSEPADIRFIKRVVGAGGDTLAMRGGGLIRNGRRVDEPYARRCDGDMCDFPREIQVPRGHVFVLGDNRGASDDSRFWGPVPEDWVRGRVVARYWPPSRAGGLG